MRPRRARPNSAPCGLLVLRGVERGAQREEYLVGSADPHRGQVVNHRPDGHLGFRFGLSGLLRQLYPLLALALQRSPLRFDVGGGTPLPERTPSLGMSAPSDGGVRRRCPARRLRSRTLAQAEHKPPLDTQGRLRPAARPQQPALSGVGSSRASSSVSDLAPVAGPDGPAAPFAAPEAVAFQGAAWPALSSFACLRKSLSR